MGSAESERLKKRDQYLGHKLNCDIVMKGGITSGIAYPLAVCEIATTYRLRNVGGSSAGAIAAAAAAAAEFGRDTSEGGFHRLAGLPERLAGAEDDEHSMLFELFQPQPGGEPYFRVLASLISSRIPKWKRWARALRLLLTRFWGATLLGSLLGVEVIAALLFDSGWTDRRGDGWQLMAVLLAIVGGITLLLVGAIGAAVFRAGRNAMGLLPELNFGLCSGYVVSGKRRRHALTDRCKSDYEEVSAGEGVTKPLTVWLSDEIDLLAGRPLSETSNPLTLGDLCDKDITLKMFTTNITDGTPYTLPFKQRFYFTQEELSDFFPPRVVSFLMQNHGDSGSVKETLLEATSEHGRLIPLPEWRDIPVVVATRMSLSFPLLLAAVPLWQIDFLKDKPYRCWFSDGGITSNFPIHFFDGPIPRWPTFGLNLGPFFEGEEPAEQQGRNIYAPLTNSAGMRPRWSQIASVPGFISAIADTMQNWSDNSQMHLPGYRDRTVLIKHTKAEGGMNLDMSRPLILNFSERGRCAGRRLVERFSTQPPGDEGDRLSWDNHRWVRYRSSMRMMEVYFERWLRAYLGDPQPSLLSFPELVGSNEPPSYKKWSASDRETAIEVTQGFEAMIRQWLNLPSGCPVDEFCRGPEREPESFDRDRPFSYDVPDPKPILRATPDF